mgnify:CR=1 FL=1|tara:strand:+ start:7354 stop:7560 length:207 start_codon:yes stop_codon:yes gene_type:complete
MKIGDLVRVKAAAQTVYGHGPSDTGLIVELLTRGPHAAGPGLWILWSGESKPRLFASPKYIEVVNENL